MVSTDAPMQKRGPPIWTTFLDTFLGPFLGLTLFNWMNECMHGWVGGRTDGRTDGWMINEWMDEWMIYRTYYILLYLPTQKRFLIGGERVKCHWSKLNDPLGRTKLNDALGKQYLERWTRTWSSCAPWNRGKFVYRSAWCKKPLK